MPGHGAAKGKGAAKAVGGIRGKAPVPELVALTPRLGDPARWIHGPAGFDELHRLSANAGDFVEFVVYDHGGMPSATSIVRMTRQWPDNVTGWFADVLFVGCSDPLFGQLLADSLPPTGTSVLHPCSSVSCLCCTWVTWPNRDVIHSDTLRKRSASSLVESWVPPSVVASAVLPRAQTQGRAAQVDPPHRNFFGPKILETLPSVAKAVPKPSDNTARTPPVPYDSSVLPKDPSVS